MLSYKQRKEKKRKQRTNAMIKNQLPKKKKNSYQCDIY